MVAGGFLDVLIADINCLSGPDRLRKVWESIFAFSYSI